MKFVIKRHSARRNTLSFVYTVKGKELAGGDEDWSVACAPEEIGEFVELAHAAVESKAKEHDLRVGDLVVS